MSERMMKFALVTVVIFGLAIVLAVVAYKRSSPSTATPAVHTDVAELCDGMDNARDGTIDEGCRCVVGTIRPCGTNEGECVHGKSICEDTDEGVVWSKCDGDTGPVAELCDARDNDCDGQTDEGCICLSRAVEAGAVTTWCKCEGDEEYDLQWTGLRYCINKGRSWTSCQCPDAAGTPAPAE